jgi:hypothetical protein
MNSKLIERGLLVIIAALLICAIAIMCFESARADREAALSRFYQVQQSNLNVAILKYTGEQTQIAVQETQDKEMIAKLLKVIDEYQTAVKERDDVIADQDAKLHPGSDYIQ